jgi:hypothetical protein
MTETAEFPDKLQRGRPNFFLGRWRREIKQNFDTSAHARRLHQPVETPFVAC